MKIQRIFLTISINSALKSDDRFYEALLFIFIQISSCVCGIF